MVSRVMLPLVLGLVALVLLLSSPAPTSAAVCGGAGYDLSSLTFADYYWNDTVKQYNWYFHPCGNVTYSGCQQLTGDPNGNVMLCQLPYGGPPAYPVAIWTPESTQSITTWTPYGPNSAGSNGYRGVRMQLQDGGSCGGSIGDRNIIVNFQCNMSIAAGFMQIVNINETVECTYLVTVNTRATCSGPNAASGQVDCGTQGLYLNPITTTDLIWQDVANNYTYYFRPCGVVTSPQCANNPYGAVAGEAMMCQATGLNGELSPNTYDISWWNPTAATWARFNYQNVNGWRMDIADGTTCAGAGGGRSRQLTVYFVCNTAATTPIFLYLNETDTCIYRAIVQTVQACNQSGISTTTTPCGGPYDLSFATQKDLIYQPPGGSVYYVFRPCGIVDNAVCQAQGNTNQSMICQAYQGQTGTNDIAIYNPALVSYTPTLTGISMYIADGDVCGSLGPRSLTVNFVCQQGGGGGQQTINFVGWAENPTCQYTATVTTSAVCRTGRQNGYCGNNNYDFSLAGNSEYSFTTADNSYTYYFQPCGQVLNSQCNNNNATAESMMCQAVNGQPTTYDIAYYDASLVAWYKLTNGYQMFVQDGQTCGGAGYLRALTVNFICSTGAAQFYNFSEVSTCNYVAFIYTPQACAPVAQGSATGITLVAPSSTGGNAYAYEAITKCGGIYNLLPLSTTDLTYQAPGTEYRWVFRPCGAVSSDNNCTSAAASTSGGWMLCQDSQYGYGAFEGSSYNQYTASWTATRQGVIMQQSDGANCGTFGNRVTRAVFVCNPSATTAVMTNVTENPTCTYTLTIQTNLVCPVAATTCGGAGYSVAALTTRGVLSYVAFNGFTYYFSPCGTVQNAQCQSNPLSQSAMMCQASQTSNATYNLGVYVPQAITWTALSNGVQMVVQDGSTCDNYDFERVLTVNFLCGQQGPYSMNVSEVTLCNYVANVNTALACNQINTGTSGGGGSSGLSGGAIAGIVIGSVVGALIILALLLVVCCGAAGGGLRRKNKGMNDEPKASGRYGDMETEDVSQSNVEMETAGAHGEA